MRLFFINCFCLIFIALLSKHVTFANNRRDEDDKGRNDDDKLEVVEEEEVEKDEEEVYETTDNDANRWMIMSRR